jgi:outer membrane lipoprotein-sorting protein
MKRNRFLLPLGAMMALLALAAVVMLARASADDMLHQAARLLADAQTGHAIVEVQVDMPDESASGIVEIWGQRDAGPEGEPAFRMEVLQASKTEAQGIVVVGDGDQVWIWNPGKNTVYVGTREELKAKMAEHKESHDRSDFDRPDYSAEEWPETPEEAVDKLLEYFTAERDGSEDVAGMAASKLRLIPIPEQIPEEMRANGGLLNIWLRASDNAPLAAEYTGGAVGYAKGTATLLELDGALPEGVFTFDIPEGAEVVNLADIEPPDSLTVEEAAAVADFSVLTPADLPAEARLEDITEVRGAIVQRYRLSDGERFTIAQGAATAADAPGENGEAVVVRGVDGLLFSDDGGQRSLLTWSEGDVTFWIGGDLTADEALAIAESLQ